MASNTKSLQMKICEGCLSKDRKLLPIKQYLSLYKKLTGDFLSETLSNKTTTSLVPLMCWECRSMLRNTQKFLKRIKLAHEILTMKNMDTIKNQSPSLSTLTIFTKITPDYVITHCQETNLASYQTHNEKVKTIYGKDEYKNDIAIELLDIDAIKKETEDYDDVKLEESSYIDEMTGDADDVENIATVGIHVENVKNEMGVDDRELRKRVTIEKRKLSMKSKYTVIKHSTNDSRSFEKLCLKVEIDEEERQRCLARARERMKYVNATFKCENCINGFYNRKLYERHLKIFHSYSNKFACDLCGIRVKSKMKLSTHIKSHAHKYVCVLCGYECLKRLQLDLHLKYEHQRCVECRKCGLRLLYKEFYKHYNSMHRTFICDYCGFKSGTKHRIAKHIRIKHMDNICKFCNKKYAVYHSMVRHIALRHTKHVSEDTYCVECNMQFENVSQYKRHLVASVKHKPKIGFPCPECHKVYAKKTAMNNHYKYIHLQKTNYYCDKCSRYFLNGFRLRTHIASYHNKTQPPKNKMCSYCGRGFTTNRILENHIRTHTGERPFACAHCTATFAQKCALVSHTRAIHKTMIRYANTQ